MKLFLFALFLIGCFAPSNIVKEKRGIFISIFKNNTREYGLSNELNLAMIDEIMKDPNFRIEKRDDAELTLKGCIIDYKKTPIAWDLKIYRMSITIEYELFDKGSLIQKEILSSEIIYPYKDNEQEEGKRLLKNISRAMVNRLK